MRPILLALLLTTSASAQVLQQTPAAEADAARIERDQHPERWRGPYWFSRTPTGDASLRRYERSNPNASRERPRSRSESDVIAELRAEIRRLQMRIAQLEQGNWRDIYRGEMHTH